MDERQPDHSAQSAGDVNPSETVWKKFRRMTGYGQVDMDGIKMSTGWTRGPSPLSPAALDQQMRRRRFWTWVVGIAIFAAASAILAVLVYHL